MTAQVKQQAGPTSAQLQIASGGMPTQASVDYSNVSSSQSAGGGGGQKFMPKSITGEAPSAVDMALQSSNFDNLTNNGGGFDGLLSKVGGDVNFLAVLDEKVMPFGIGNPQGFDVQGAVNMELSTATSVASNLSLGGPASGIYGGTSKGGQSASL